MAPVPGLAEQPKQIPDVHLTRASTDLCPDRFQLGVSPTMTPWSIPQAESRGRKGRLGVSLKRQLEDGKDALDIARAATRGSQASDGAATRAGRDRFKGDMEEMDAIKKRRKAIRGTFTRIINEINGEFEKSQIDRNDIYSKFNRLESYYTKLVDLNEKYQALLVVKEGITEESIDREWQECDKYEEEKFDIQQKVSVLRNPDKEETIPIASEDTVINVKLPELALKTYDGSLEGWLPWWAQFSKIHENKNLSDSDRFLYLRQAIVPNSEAYRVVASYPVTGANYALAVQALQERFGDPNILTELYVRRLLNSVISNVKKENRNLSSLYDELSSHLRSLETLGIDPQLSGIFLYPLVESSLPSDILKIWHRHPSSGYGMELAKREESDKGVGGAQERLRLLLDFLKAEVRSAQRLKFVEKGFKQEEPYKRSYNDGTRTRSNFRPATVSSLFGGRTNIKCFFCERTNHASHQCRSIMKMSPGERNDKIRSAHLCFKCLRKGHIQSQCREQLECKNCGRNHLEVLCEGNSSNRLTKPGRENLKENAPEPIASLSSQACTGQVLLMTTVALLRGPNASRRVIILLDSGSQFSYIKQSLVWSIGIERKGEITIAKSLFGGNKIGEEKHGKFMLELENLGNKRDVIHIEALDQRQEIDILIGANCLGMILTGKIVQVEADLTAVETKLGWTLMGNSPIIDSNDNVQQTLNLLTTRCDLKDLWDLEVLGIRDPVETCSKETRYQEIKEKFITKIQRQSNQRYSVGLPWKVEKESIPSNLDIAIKRLDISTKKMTSQNKLTEYSQIFRDWLTEGLIERVEENPLERRGYYLPHRPVYKMESKTTPIRPVFDASCLGHNGLSLNQCLEKGPNLLERIPETMIRFRENKFGVTADIRKAFQMVAIEESERNYLRFLWWEKESDRELIAYRHKRLVFGLNCSPFVLNAVIEYHLQSIRGPLVQWAKILAQSFYMDNCITSLETKQEVQEFQKAAIEIMDRAKMDLREWEYSLEENPEKGTCTKILGVVWNKMEDSLKCELPDNLSLQPKLTKRLVLSMVQRIFDPLGFCAPVFLPPKLLLQRSWGLKLGWDTPLPESMAQEFRTWLGQIKLIELIKIPRYMWNDLIFPTEVHIFCDASQIGYGAVAYLRSETGRENTLTLIWSKVRLAPMKSITIPRLELMAMVLGARLANAIQAALKRKCETTLWSDSTTALSWIKKEIEWRVFVRNRVREIQATTNLNDWRFVPSQLNPADLLSRGCPPSQFVQSRWWEGPEWLKKPKEFWPNSERSDYSLNIRVMSYVLRFLGKLKKQSTETGPLKVSELDLAEKKLIRMIQEKVSIEKSNATKSFKILKNTDGLWCVESKLLHGQVPEEFKTPIILPGDHPFVEQLIWEVHLKNGHVGVQFILSKLREKFWIIRGRKTIKKIISKCIACKRLKEKSLQRPMAALPENRIGLGKPFQITGVDLLGTLHLKEGGKVWVAAFTCAVYRAIHLELVKSLETGVFMMALHRFICRRGRPEKIYSDNGTNFAKLNRIFKRLDWTRIERETSIKRIQWIFIPPSAPWWGGFWERMVRTIKEMLIKMLGHRKLKYVQLQTALFEIESIINNRPLTYVSEDDNDLKPLTPNEFLQNGPESSFPEFENLKPEMLHTRYRELGQLKRELKQRFLKEYLGALIQKSENIDRRQLKVGDVVLIGQENLKRMFWLKGRIVNLIPGKDGIVRVAHVKTSTGTLIRALQRLHPLEISSNVKTIQMDNSNTEPQSDAFLGNRPNIESRDSRNRYGRRLVDGKTSEKYPTSSVLWTERTPWSIPQAESRGRKGRLGVSLKRQLEDGKDALDIARAATRGSQASDGAATRDAYEETWTHPDIEETIAEFECSPRPLLDAECGQLGLLLHQLEAENQMNLKVSKIRCDNGGEYVNEDIKSWCKAKGIIMDLTIPHSPQLNGKAERLNRTLMEKTRALLIDSGVEKYMWGEAVRVSAYLLNRSPTQELEKPLQNFGSTKDQICYAPNGYRLWDEQSKRIFTARDVIFLDKGCINKEEKIPIVEPEEESEDQLELNEEPSLPEVSEDKEDIPTKPSTSKYNLRPRSSLQTPSRYEDFYLEQDGTTESALLTYSEAISGPNQEKWKKAIKEEKESLAKNEVWEIVKENEASNKKILTSNWLFKVKEDGRYKARLVVRGFEQEAGIDYDETFSPVISTVSLRMYFALMAKRRQAIGSLLYLTNKTRPDMTFATNFESRSMHDPTTQDIINIKRTLRYLNHTTNLGISYDGEMPFELNVYCDSDFAGDIKTSKSTTGYVVYLCGGPISWCSRKQPVIALSSTEAEFIAAADACKEVSDIRSLLEELITDNFDINLYVDNQSTIKIVKSGQFTTKTKHIDVKYHFVKDQAQKFNLIYCPTEHQIADILTKPLARPKFDKFKSLLMTTI
ncbi:hypothetical protein LAZ67_14002313 [Cordylochernes scorpioides]|uniref:Pro-Pol polyprotein n=1 Tax=Cordylochernes scorpioides TaxID=51811 RepID=A0ABY6L6W8_9ARAC|nr:hypothetical protein LAZ67_14002313 [Cordylochernes scorpioides]